MEPEARDRVAANRNRYDKLERLPAGPEPRRLALAGVSWPTPGVLARHIGQMGAWRSYVWRNVPAELYQRPGIQPTHPVPRRMPDTGPGRRGARVSGSRNMTVDDVMRLFDFPRAEFEGREPTPAELMVAEIKRLRALIAELSAPEGDYPAE